MAEKPLGTNHLPADLPTDWVNSQTITADGTEAGLGEKRGYNYLNSQVNATQEAVNLISDTFVALTALDTFESHEEDENVHVTSADRTKWNAAMNQAYVDGQDSTMLASAKDYADAQIASITGSDETVIAHVNNQSIHVSVQDKQNWNNKLDNNKKTIILQKRGDPVDSSYYAAATGTASLNQTVTWEIPISGPYDALISYNIDLYSTTSTTGGTGHKVEYLINGISQNSTYNFTSSNPAFRTTHTNQIFLENMTAEHLVFACNASNYRNGKTLTGTLHLKGWNFTLMLFPRSEEN